MESLRMLEGRSKGSALDMFIFTNKQEKKQLPSENTAEPFVYTHELPQRLLNVKSLAELSYIQAEGIRGFSPSRLRPPLQL